MSTATAKGTQMDSRIETYKHIHSVQCYLRDVVTELLQRQSEHDDSKLHSPEVEVFDEFTPKLAGCTYGSDEYKGYLQAMQPALQHHYTNNSHHPEHYPWHCPVCSIQISQDAYAGAPQGPNESGVRYCPRCCRNGMLYESELMRKPELGIRGMSLLDLVEMLCDWKAATMRHLDGDIGRSIEINQKRFGYTDEMKAILQNTVREMWPTA